MQPTLGGAICRRALLTGTSRSQMKFASRAFSQLTITPTTRSRTPLSKSPSLLSKTTKRNGSSPSSSQWLGRQFKDQYRAKAIALGLRSRAAFKLLELDKKYTIFKPKKVVVDLGYAPGSWSQVAIERTKPDGIVVGIDLIPVQPPKGVTSIQGDFLSPQVQQLVKHVVREQITRRDREWKEARALKREREAATAAAIAEVEAEAARQAEAEAKGEAILESESDGKEEEKEGDNLNESRNEGMGEESEVAAAVEDEAENAGAPARKEQVNEKKANGEEDVLLFADRPSYIDMEKIASHDTEDAEAVDDKKKMVDIVISDMSEPWPQTSGFRSQTISNQYRRLMNVSGNAFRDHTGSMDLCYAALQFASDTLKDEGHFICKYYMGDEVKRLEATLKKMFKHVHRQKPYASREASKEMFFVAMKKKRGVVLEDVNQRITRSTT